MRFGLNGPVFMSYFLPGQIGVTTANSVVVPDIEIMYYIGVEISVVRCINRNFERKQNE